MSKAIVRDKLTTIIMEQLGVDAGRASNIENKIIEDLGADSLDVVQIIMEIEDAFEMEIPDEEAETLVTVDALLEYVNDHHTLDLEPVPAAKGALPFNETTVLAYLDSSIKGWREKKEGTDNADAKVLAGHYIDAYQSVRTSLFGEVLP